MCVSVVYTCITGARECGKSTLSKQIHIIYKQGYSIAQRIRFRPQVLYHIKTSIYTLLEAMGQLELSFADPDAGRHALVLGWPDVNKHTLQEPFFCVPALDEV